MRSSFPLLAVLTAGCWVGQRASTFRPAQAPAGVTIELQLHSGAAVSGELLAVDDTGYLVIDTCPFPNSAQAIRHSALFTGEIVRITAPSFLPYPDRATVVRKFGDTLWVRTSDRDAAIPVSAVTKVERYKEAPPGGFVEWQGGPRITFVLFSDVTRASLYGMGLETKSVARDSAFIDHARSVSRYPQGVTPQLLAALLEAYGQPSLEKSVPA